MRWGSLFLGLFIIMLFTAPNKTMAESSLQMQIDATPSGETLQISGEYQESIKMDRPITIIGSENTKIISSCSEEVAITIGGNNVALKNIYVESCNDSKGSTAIAISGQGHHLENMSVKTLQYGIKLNGATETTLSNVTIQGIGKENGIDLWESSHNLITGTTLENVQDGIYLENSHDNQIIDNEIRNSRYGIHLMFSNQTKLINNVSSHNHTGAMIMGTNDTIVENNQLLDNNVNVHAQGLLLYDTKNAKIVNNIISGNRVGMYIDGASRNIIESNLVQQNFIGMQFYQSNGNIVQNNSFLGNVNDSQAIQSEGNKIQRNYWDLSLKLDQKETGYSVIPYTSDPYFLAITTYTPEFQLFFHSPGMLVLQKLLKNQDEKLFKDELTRMVPTVSVENKTTSRLSLWILSIAMIGIGLSTFHLGRR